MEELGGNEAFYSCASSYVGQLDLNIAGPDSFCTTVTYNVSNLSNASVLEWSVIPVSSATISNINNTFTLTRNSFYSGWITLSASTSISCQDVIIDKQVWAGSPTVVAKLSTGEYLSHDSRNTVCKQQQITTNMTVNGGTNVNWILLSSSHTTTWGQSGDNLSFYLWAIGHTATFRFTTKNSYGTITRGYIFVSENCGGGGGDPCDLSMTYSIYPNPSSTNIVLQPNIPGQIYQHLVTHLC